MKRIKQLIKRLLPGSLRSAYKRYRLQLIYRQLDRHYEEVLEKLKTRSEIKVAFYIFNADTWKVDTVYQAFENSERFIPYLVICPFTYKGDPHLKLEFDRCIALAERYNYRYVIGFKGETINEVEKIEIPHFDIVFYSNPNLITAEPYAISHDIFLGRRSLNCYVPYSFNIAYMEAFEYDNFRLNYMFRSFTSTPFQHDMYRQHSVRKGSNCYFSGFPQFDRYSEGSEWNPWKNPFSGKKKIVWGPHWTIPGMQDITVDWGCFHVYADKMLELADKYRDHVELALKPHPFLIPVLEEEQNWGKRKTRAYLDEWENRENCQLVLGDYMDLFIHSDALVHDSGSFAVEYLCVNKPVAYTTIDDKYLERFSEIGQDALSRHHIVYDPEQLEEFFIQVISGEDPIKKTRETFLEKTLRADGQAGIRVVEHLEDLLAKDNA